MFDNCHDDSVCDKKLNDDIEHGDHQNIPLEATSQKYTNPVPVYYENLLPETLLTREMLVVFESSKLFLFSHHHLRLSESLVLLSFLLDVLLRNFDKCVLKTVKLDINLHLWNLCLHLLNKLTDLVHKVNWHQIKRIFISGVL